MKDHIPASWESHSFATFGSSWKLFPFWSYCHPMPRTPPELFASAGDNKSGWPMDGESFCCCQKPDKISQIRRAPSSRITHFINGLDSIDLHLHLPSYLSRSMILHYFSPVFQSLTIYIYVIYTLMIIPSQASVPRHHSKHSWSDAIDWEDLLPGEVAFCKLGGEWWA